MVVISATKWQMNTNEHWTSVSVHFKNKIPWKQNNWLSMKAFRFVIFDWDEKDKSSWNRCKRIAIQIATNISNGFNWLKIQFSHHRNSMGAEKTNKIKCKRKRTQKDTIWCYHIRDGEVNINEENRSEKHRDQVNRKSCKSGIGRFLGSRELNRLC